MLKINEIFYSIQCEGFNTGHPAIFIRLAGCNLACKFCDTDFSCNREMTEEEIIKEIKEYKCNMIVITGGEPLLQDLGDLLEKLKGKGYDICLETNGTIEIPLHWQSFDWVTVSPKMPIRDIELETYTINEIKLIIDSDVTEKEFKKNIEEAGYLGECLIYLQPCWVDDSVQRQKNIDNTVELVKKFPYDCRLSLQGQKYIQIK